MKKLRYRLEWLMVLFVAKIIPLLSRRGCYRLGGFLGACAATLDRPGRHVALSNLEAALGNQLSPRQRRTVNRQSYQCFLRAMLDLFWLPRLTKENFGEWMEVVGLDEVLASVAPGQGIIFTTFHYGNVEWAAQLIGLRGFRGITVALGFKNPLLGPIFARLRTHSGNELSPSKRAFLNMYKAVQRGRFIAVTCDDTIKPRDPCVAITCFGIKKCVTYAHAWLHQRTGAALVPIYCEPLRNGRYRYHFFPKLEFAKGTSIVEITQRCWDHIEPVVRQNPSPWTWRYKHWRYRLAGSPKPYPFYAESGPRFEARLNAVMAEFEREAAVAHQLEEAN
jgi:KDO2-lipid IV(A) lauroyltransferase